MRYMICKEEAISVYFTDNVGYDNAVTQQAMEVKLLIMNNV